MALRLDAFVTRYGPPILASQVENFEEQDVPSTVFEILSALAPYVPGNTGKKARLNKKKLHQQRLDRAALHAIGQLSLQEPQRPFEAQGDQLKTYKIGKTLTEFKLFNQFAPEIRAMIWKEALPDAQAVKITADGYNYQERPTLMRSMNRYVYRAKASYVPSPLLSVNREAHAIVESQYPLSFATQLGGRPIRFNFKMDILYFECPTAMVSFYGGTLPMFNPELQVFGFRLDMSEIHNKVQHVAIGNVKFYKAAVGATLNQFKALKTVALSVTQGENFLDPHDKILDFVTGDKRLAYGWERYQNFKTPEDGNMPLVERLRPDEFNKLVEVKYKRYVRVPELTPHLPQPTPLVDSMPFKVANMNLNSTGKEKIKTTTITVPFVPSPSASPMDWSPFSPGVRVNF